MIFALVKTLANALANEAIDIDCLQCRILLDSILSGNIRLHRAYRVRMNINMIIYCNHPYSTERLQTYCIRIISLKDFNVAYLLQNIAAKLQQY